MQLWCGIGPATTRTWSLNTHCVAVFPPVIVVVLTLQQTLIIGADYYESEDQREKVLAKGGVPLGVGSGTVIKNCIVDKNARIGRNVQIINKDGVQVCVCTCVCMGGAAAVCGRTAQLYVHVSWLVSHERQSWISQSVSLSLAASGHLCGCTLLDKCPDAA